jgi:type III pantothenate kinase
VWEQWSPEAFLQLATNQKAHNIILSSVAGVMPAHLEQQAATQFYYLPLKNQTPLPFKNLYRTPLTLGIDRLAAVAGALASFPAQNCLVVDAGTCMTYELLTAQAEYLGGNIAPGIAMRLKAMHAFTAKLPEVSKGETEDWVGYSTESALRNGAQWGAAFEIEGTIARLQGKFSPLTVILTGGDAIFLAKMLKSQIFVLPDLVLIGLNKILNHNVQQVA